MDYLYSVAKISLQQGIHKVKNIHCNILYCILSLIFFFKQLSKTKQIIIQQHVQDKEKGLEKTSLQKHNMLTNALD